MKRKKVLALMKYGDRAASTRQRLQQYLPSLAAAGFDVEVEALFDNHYLERLASRATRSAASVARAYASRLRTLSSVSRYDVVFVHYEAVPYLPAIFERFVASRSRALIYDFDDAIFHQYDAHANPLVRAMLGQKLAPLLRRADVCICGNAYLESYARRFSNNTMIIPTVVDAERYAAVPADERGGVPVVGWIGSPSTYEQLKAVLMLLNERRISLGVDLKVIGSGLAPDAMPGVDFQSWAEETEVADIAAMDIGIMPLPDEPWARGKCGYKLIQYMACGLPVVASPVGVNVDIVDHGVNGFLAQTPDDWLEAARRLAGDASLRRRMGEAGRAKVAAHYSLQAQAPHMVAAFQKAAKL